MFNDEEFEYFYDFDYDNTQKLYKLFNTEDIMKSFK